MAAFPAMFELVLAAGGVGILLSRGRKRTKPTVNNF
jgi:hypothetical protein